MLTDLLLPLLSAKGLYQTAYSGACNPPSQTAPARGLAHCPSRISQPPMASILPPKGPQSTAVVRFSPAPTSDALAVISSQTDT